MSAVISLFPLASMSRGGWSQQELAEFYRVEAALTRAGLRIASEQGLSDEGEPWFVFCHPDGDEIMHFARIDGSYLIASAVLDNPARGSDFRALINYVAQRHPELLPIPTAGDGTRLSVHPAALLAALVAAAALILSPDDAFASEGGQKIPGIAPPGSAGLESRSPSPDSTRTGHPEERSSHRKHADAILLSAMIFAANASNMDHADARTGPDLLSGSPTDSGAEPESRVESVPGQAAEDVGHAVNSSGSLPPVSNGPSGSRTQSTAADASGASPLPLEQPDLGKNLSKDFGREVGSLDRRQAATASDAPHTLLQAASEASSAAAEADAAHHTGSSSALGVATAADGAGQGNGSTSTAETATFERYAPTKALPPNEAATGRGPGAFETARADSADVKVERDEAGQNGASSEKRGAASEMDGATEHTAAAFGKQNGDKNHSDFASKSSYSEDRHNDASAPSQQSSLKVSSPGGRDTLDAAAPTSNDAGPSTRKDVASDKHDTEHHGPTRETSATGPEAGSHVQPDIAERSPSEEGRTSAGGVHDTGDGSHGHGGTSAANAQGAEQRGADTQAQSGPQAIVQSGSISGESVHARAETDLAIDPSASRVSRSDQSKVHDSGTHGAPVPAETSHADAQPAGPDSSPAGSSSGSQAGHGGQIASGAASSHAPDGIDRPSSQGLSGDTHASKEIGDAPYASPALINADSAMGHSAEDGASPAVGGHASPAVGGHASHGLTDTASLRTASSEGVVSLHDAPEAGTAQVLPSNEAQGVSATAKGHFGDAGSGARAVQDTTLAGTGIGDKAAGPGAQQSAVVSPAVEHRQSASAPDQLLASDPAADAASLRSPAHSISGTPAHDQTPHVEEANITKPPAASVDVGGNLVFSVASPNGPSPKPADAPLDDHGHATIGVVGIQDHSGMHHLDFHA